MGPNKRPAIVTTVSLASKVKNMTLMRKTNIEANARAANIPAITNFLTLRRDSTIDIKKAPFKKRGNESIAETNTVLPYLFSSGLYRRRRNYTCSCFRSWAITTGNGLSPFPKDINFEYHGVAKGDSVMENRYKVITYARISETTPEPTVLPPSRIAKRRPFSIAIGVMSSTFITTLSPGRHMSTSAGSWMVPVTSVVLK